MYILCHNYTSIVWYRIDGHKGNFGHLDTLQFKELGASKGSCEAASTLQVPAHVTLQWCGFCTSDAVHHGASSRSHLAHFGTEISEIRYRALRKPLASSRIDIDQMQKRLTMMTMTTMTTMTTMRMRMRVMVMVMMMMMAMVAMKWSNPVAIFWLHTLAFMQIFLNPK